MITYELNNKNHWINIWIFLRYNFNTFKVDIQKILQPKLKTLLKTENLYIGKGVKQIQDKHFLFLPLL